MGQFPLQDNCKQKAEALNMPTFTLLACDDFAVSLVRRWVKRAEAAGTPKEKTDEARELIKRMEKYRKMHPEQCKIPD